MKALFFQDGDDVHVELISENQAEREELIKRWQNESMAVSCEEWREMSESADQRSV